MVKIKGTTIKMTRGDTLKVKIDLFDAEGNEYIPQPGDVIRFAMKTNYEDRTPLILKTIPNDSLILILNPSDTKSLEMPADYVYDIEITFANGDVDTFIDKAKLSLTEEVH